MQCDIEHALLVAGAKNVRFESQRYFFTVNGDSHPWQLEVQWDDLTVLPEFFLATEHCSRHHPHVSWNRKVCYSDGEGISFDYEMLEAVLAEALAEAVAVLDAGDDGDLCPFWDESEGYFNLLDKRENRGNASCYFPIDGNPRKLKSSQQSTHPYRINFFENNTQCWLPDSSSSFKALALKKGGRKEQCNPAAFYLPLDKPPVPPLPGQAWTIGEILGLVEPFIGKVPDLDKHLKKRQQYYVFSTPRSDGSRGAFAVHINQKNAGEQIRYYTVHRHARDYLLARGGLPEVQPKTRQRVAIIGCGAVGGYLANLLAQNGYQDFTLVDYDTFHADNCYRHILPKHYVGVLKVFALKHLLEKSYIEVSITPVDKSANDWATPENIAGHPVIISATGNPTLERRLNQLFQQQNLTGHIFLSTWLEPVGLGGHVVLTTAESQGCLNCLFTKENEFSAVPTISFIEPGQKITRNLTGCGGAFTPFSGLDAQQTALMAARTLEAYLCGQRNSIYDCWIGNRKVADLAKIATSAVYDTHFAEKQDWWQQKLRHGCPECRRQ
jgi:molybdopterin/thiamine biosynthesis adenylyltransferase